MILGNGQGSNNTGLPNLGSVQYYVGIVPDGASELAPRVALTAVPYAFTASALDPNATVLGAQVGTGINATNITTGTLNGALVGAGVSSANIAGNLAGAQVGTGINASNITTGALGGGLVGTGISATNITTGTLPIAQIADGSITTAKLATGIDASKITVGTLPAAQIATTSIDNTKLATGIDASKITTGTLPIAQIADASITNAKIISMDGGKLTGTVAGSSVGTGISASNVNTGVLPAAQIGAGTIDNTKLAGGIDAAKITTGTLPTSVIPASVGDPVGTIIAYGGTVVPASWLLCDGTAVSRTTYAALFTALSVTWGGGNGSTTFNLPDLRGRFLRGRDNSAGNDPDAAARIALFTLGATGDNVGSYQTDDFKSHNHYGGVYYYYNGQNGGYGNVSGIVQNTPTQNTGGNESRPKNAFVMYLIKYQ